MKRYEMNVEKQELGDLSAHHVEYTESPDGEWVKFEDVPGLTVKGQRIPDTVEEWQHLAALYAQQIEDDKLTIAQLKQRINNARAAR